MFTCCGYYVCVRCVSALRCICLAGLALVYTSVQKFEVSKFFFFLKEINTFIQQGCIKLIKNYSKDI